MVGEVYGDQNKKTKNKNKKMLMNYVWGLKYKKKWSKKYKFPQTSFK